MLASSNNNNNNGFQQPKAPPAAAAAAAARTAATTTTTTTTTTTMEDKLHGVAASFRRERDEAHRRQWTAKERLRLVEQEAQAMAATVESMEKDYKALQQKMGNEQELQTLMKDVDLLTKEMQFQHAELIDKREKCVQLQRTQEMEDQKRKNALSSMDVVLVVQRTKLQKIMEQQGSLILEDDDSMLLKKHEESLELALANDHDGRLDEKWPRLIWGKAQAILEDTESARHACESLERIVGNYKHNLHVCIDENSEQFFDTMQYENEELVPAPHVMQHADGTEQEHSVAAPADVCVMSSEPMSVTNNHQ